MAQKKRLNESLFSWAVRSEAQATAAMPVVSTVLATALRGLVLSVLMDLPRLLAALVLLTAAEKPVPASI